MLQAVGGLVRIYLERVVNISGHRYVNVICTVVPLESETAVQSARYVDCGDICFAHRCHDMI